jgi:hypothetical protein
MKLTTHLQLVPRSRKGGSIHPLVKHRDNFTFFFMSFEMRPPFRQEEGSDYFWSFPFCWRRQCTPVYKKKYQGRGKGTSTGAESEPMGEK